MLTFSVLCDECCLILHECHVERNFSFLFMNLCLRLNQLVLIRSVRGVCSFGPW